MPARSRRKPLMEALAGNLSQTVLESLHVDVLPVSQLQKLADSLGITVDSAAKEPPARLLAADSVKAAIETMASKLQKAAGEDEKEPILACIACWNAELGALEAEIEQAIAAAGPGDREEWLSVYTAFVDEVAVSLGLEVA